MRFVDEYRAPEQVMQLIEHLRERASHLSYTAERPLRIMEVCGGHTHAIFKFGLDQLLPENVEFIHGPGCPVCVLPMGRIDTCVEIASHPEVIFCTFGDAMRVPGKQGSLLQAKARGADVRIVYSPMDALKLAQENPTRKVVFFGLGFETTMPTTAITLQQAKARDVQNFYFFCQHITLIPTLRSLLEQPDNGIDAFLAPGHVSMVIGTDAYNFIASDFQRPLVVAGFEPLDLLQGVVMLVEQKIAAHSKVTEIVASNPGDIEKRVAFFHGIGTAAITAFRNVPILTVIDDASVFHLYRLLSYWLHWLDLRLLRCRRRPHFRRRRNQHTRIGMCRRIAINGADRCRWI